jgi:hypothetical protein
MHPAIAFILKYSVDHDLIPPATRETLRTGLTHHLTVHQQSRSVMECGSPLPLFGRFVLVSERLVPGNRRHTQSG